MYELGTYVGSAAITRRFPFSLIKNSYSLTLTPRKSDGGNKKREKSLNRFILKISSLDKAHEQLHKPWMLSPPRNSFTAQTVCLTVLSEWRLLSSSATSSSVRLAHQLSTQSSGSNVGSSSRSGPGSLLSPWLHSFSKHLKCVRHS